jgi:preprotein translocase subunit SecA
MPQERVYPEEWDWAGLSNRLFSVLGWEWKVDEEKKLNYSPSLLQEDILQSLQEIYEKKVQEIGEPLFRDLERYVLLRVVDSYWKDHLRNMDHLREGIGLRAVGQRDPFVEYQIEAFDMFQDMVAHIREDTIRYLLHLQVVAESKKSLSKSSSPKTRREKVATVRSKNKVGRNDPCPCGSGLKYKHCCGKNE